MDENLSYNPEFDGEEVQQSEVNESVDRVLSIPNDPYYFLNKIQKYFTISSIREALCRVGGKNEAEQMLYDPHISAAMEKRKAGIRGAKITFASDSEEESDFIKTIITPEIVNHVLKNIWETWFWGYSVDELIWKKEGDLISIDTIRKVPFYWFNPANDLKSVFYKETLAAERTLQYDEPATYGKYLLTTKDGTYYRPHGHGIAFSIYFVSKFKEMGWSFWGEWLQKYASGFIKAAISEEQGADKKKLAQIKDDLAKAIRGAAIVYKQGSEVEIVYPSSSGEQFKTFRDSAIDDIQMSILGETLTSRVDSGSMAAATVHDGIQKEKIQLDMSLVEQALDRLIEYVYTLNFRDKTNMPRAEVMFEKTLQRERAERDEIVARTTNRPFSVDYLVDSYGYKEEDFEEAPLTENPFGESPDELSAKIEDVLSKIQNVDDLGKKRSGILPDGETFGLDEKEIDSIQRRKERRIDDLTTLLTQNEDFALDSEDLFAAIEASETQAQLMKNLTNLVNIDNTDFEELLTQALFYQFGEGLKGTPE